MSIHFIALPDESERYGLEVFSVRFTQFKYPKNRRLEEIFDDPRIRTVSAEKLRFIASIIRVAQPFEAQALEHHARRRCIWFTEERRRVVAQREMYDLLETRRHAVMIAARQTAHVMAIQPTRGR
jgi:hypothetical protein